jgi:triosephosphate isomerase
MRAPFVVANWKMHLDRAAIAAFCRELRGLEADLAAQGSALRLGVCPPSCTGGRRRAGRHARRGGGQPA